MPEFICGIDTGGTFTDCVLIDTSSGQIVTTKALSTPDDFSIGLFESMERAAEQVGIALDELVGSTAQMIVGTTVGTNAFLERKGAVTGLLVTRGFRDTLHIMRGVGRVQGLPPEDAMMLATSDKPAPLVPKRLIREVAERVDWEGEILLEPDRDEVLAAARDLVEQGADAISVCLLWSFKNPVNEQRVRDWVTEAHPDLYVTCSHEVAPKIGEYERFSGTTINAYVGPTTRRYLDGVADSVGRRGYRQRLLVMGCDGGVRSAEVAAEEAIITLNSGPAGGVTGSASLARQLDLRDVITADVGGTSFDVGVIKDGQIDSSDKTVLGQYEFFIPAIDVRSIGAGGGSIAWVDPRRRTLRVGPESAGADPGPVCYGRGGSRPTLTDAALVLGYLSERSFLGKGGRLDVDGAQAALGELGGELGLDWRETALGVVTIAEALMADLVRRVLVMKGYDPRDFSLFAYGGAGPLHAPGFSRALNLSSIVVPAGDSASVWSAYGVATSDIKHVYEYAAVFGEPFDADGIRSVYAELAEKGRARLAEEEIGVDETAFQFEAGMRYVGQLHEVYVEAPAADRLTSGAIQDVVAGFESKYARVYGEEAGFRHAGVELIDFRLTTVTPVERPSLASVDGAAAEPAKGERLIHFAGYDADGPERATVYEGHLVRTGTRIEGPAAIELPGTTIVVPPDHLAERDQTGSYVLTRR